MRPLFIVFSINPFRISFSPLGFSVSFPMREKSFVKHEKIFAFPLVTTPEAFFFLSKAAAHIGDVFFLPIYRIGDYIPRIFQEKKEL